MIFLIVTLLGTGVAVISGLVVFCACVLASQLDEETERHLSTGETQPATFQTKTEWPSGAAFIR